MVIPQSPTIMTWLMWGPVCLEAAIVLLLDRIATWLDKFAKEYDLILGILGLGYFGGIVIAATGMDIYLDKFPQKDKRGKHDPPAR